MDLARTSRYWTTYRASKTFRLTIFLYDAHLGFSSSVHGSSNGDTSGMKVVARVSLPNDPTGEHYETRQGRAPNPVWDQAIVLNDVAYTEVVRLEVLGTRKIGDNPVLARKEFEVHDVMGLSLKDEASVFQLECDRSRARFGVITMAFQFDPPVVPDVVGGLNEAAPRLVPPAGNKECHQRNLQSMARACSGEKSSEPGREAVEPVYMNVAGHFACLLLDDDVPLPQADLAKEAHAPSTSFVVPPLPQAPNGEPAYKIVHSVRPDSRPPQPARNASQDRRTHGSFTSESDASSSDVSESMKHREGDATRRLRSGVTSNNTSGSGGGAKSTEDSRQRSSSFGGLAYQLSSFGGRAGVGIGKVTPPLGTKVTHPATPLSLENSPLVESSKRLDETPPQQRWKMGRLRQSKQEDRGGVQASVASGSVSRGDSTNTRSNNNSSWSRRAANVPRPGGWKEGFLRRSFGATPSSARRFREKGLSLGRATCENGVIAAAVETEGTSPGPSTIFRTPFSADGEREEESIVTYDSRYDVATYGMDNAEGGSCWQP